MKSLNKIFSSPDEPQDDADPPVYDECIYKGETVTVVGMDNEVKGEKVRHGIGSCSYADGSTYSGAWRMGKK